MTVPSLAVAHLDQDIWNFDAKHHDSSESGGTGVRERSLSLSLSLSISLYHTHTHTISLSLFLSLRMTVQGGDFGLTTYTDHGHGVCVYRVMVGVDP